MTIPHSDLVSTILGGSVALAGLLLVFSGFLYSHAESFPPTTSDRVTDRYKGAAKLGLVPFCCVPCCLCVCCDLDALPQRHPINNCVDRFFDHPCHHLRVWDMDFSKTTVIRFPGGLNS